VGDATSETFCNACFSGQYLTGELSAVQKPRLEALATG
jgi:hypothetical protein